MSAVPTQNSASRRVVKVARGMPASDGAGVKLTRLIGGPGLPDLDPFLMLDEFRSDQAGDYLAGFPDHPHRGFETVTYMLAGRMRHGDNQGNVGLLGPGSVQWMTAGRGIVHSEMPEQEDGLMWGFQLWVNLPAKDKMTAPRYQDIDPERIPEAMPAPGVKARVIAGSFGGVTGPVQAEATDPVYLDVTLDAGGTVDVALPAGHQAFVYPFEGTVVAGEGEQARTLTRGEIAVLSEGSHVRLAGADAGDAASGAGGAGGGRVILVAGRPLREPVVKYGPFVMNTPDQIRAAILDFQAGRF